MSKADTLRGFVTERLAAAARDILAAVDRTVAGYEAEAAGCRREMERQRRQLEALLPRVQLRRAGNKQADSPPSAEEEEGEDEPAAMNLHLHQKNLRSSNPKASRIQRTTADKHLDLRVCVLRDFCGDIVPKNVSQKFQVLKLQSAGDQQGAPDVLDVLRSSLLDLVGASSLTSFDVFTSDKSRKLCKIEPLTSEEMYKYAKSTRAKNPTLYVRPRTGDVAKHLPWQRTGDGSTDTPSTSAALMNEETGTQSSGIVPDVGETDEKSPSPRQMDKDTGTSLVHSAGDLEVQAEKGAAGGSGGEQGGHPSLKRTKSSASGKLLSCRACGYLHKSNLMLVKHAWRHLADPESLCGVCGEHCESTEALKQHLQGHQKTHDCHVCGKSLLSIVSLTEHVATHTGEAPHQCHTCCKRFALKLSLRNHQRRHALASRSASSYASHRPDSRRRTHGDEKPYRCGACGKSLCDLRSLNRHKLTHTGERRHRCELCGKGFKLSGTLRTHEKIHTQRDRTYLCDVCCKMFLTNKQLQVHMRTHTQEKPYSCSQCGKGFSTKGTLTVHTRVHTGEMPYRCSECGWAFKRKTHLDNHLKVHSGQRPYVCLVCGKTCARKFYLTVHMRTHNGERPYQCSVCGRAFTQGHSLKTHMKSHQRAPDAPT